MKLEDLKEIEPCLITEFDDFWTFAMLKHELENSQGLNSHYFVAKFKNKIVGFAGILTIIDEVNIMNIVVRKDSRKLGIGSSLLNFIINFAKTQNVTSITLEVNENNLPAIGLYEKYGFKKVGLRKKYYHNIDNAILMTLSLTKPVPIGDRSGSVGTVPNGDKTKEEK